MFRFSGKEFIILLTSFYLNPLMKKITLLVTALVFCVNQFVLAQCMAVPVITLQTNGAATACGMAWHPVFQKYYWVGGGGNIGMPVETYSAVGGAPINSTTEDDDFRGLWYNSTLGVIEGNSYAAAGIYTIALDINGVATGSAGNIVASNNQPDPQSGGNIDNTSNQVIYYDSGNILKYSRATGSLVATIPITGLPVGMGNLVMYNGFFTGIPGKEYAVYDYVNQRAYFINYTTGAYVSTVQFPPSAPQPNYYETDYENGLFFLYDNNTLSWIGYQAGVSISTNSLSMCAGATETLFATGANTYTWSNGSFNSSITITPSITTTYSVTGSPIPGCPTNTAIITITVNTTPTVSVAGNTFICIGNTASLTASGATSYSWSNGPLTASNNISPTVTTIYTVTGANGICVDTKVVTVTVSPNPTVSIAGSSVICNGQSVNLTAGGANTYSWSNGANTSSIAVSPSATIVYSVTGTDANNCTNMAIHSITVNPTPNVQAQVTPTSICSGYSGSLAANGAVSYTWMPGNINGFYVSVSPSVTTNYTVSGSGANGCVNTATVNLIVLQCLGLKSYLPGDNMVTVYPNPGNGTYHVNMSDAFEGLKVSVYNVTGSLVQEKNVSGEKFTVDLSHEANGVYFIRILDNNTMLYSSRLIKQ
jgi:hypothetical protein